MTEREARRLLHVSPGCTPGQLRQAYVDLVKVWHPDRFQGDDRLRRKAEDTTRRLNEAYALLQRLPPVSGPSGAVVSDEADTAPARRPGPRPWPSRRRALALLAGLAGGAVAAVVLLRASRPAALIPGGGASVNAADIALEPAPPPERAVPPRGPESGTSLSPARAIGRGAASFRNGMSADGIVALVQDDELVRSFFVRRGEVVSVLDLVPGRYDVMLITGAGWDGARFRQARACYALTEPVDVRGPREGFAVGTLAIVLGSGSGMRAMGTCPLD